MVVWIWVKLSDFLCEYSHKIFCEFYWNNLDSSSDTAVQTLKFTFSSEHAVVHWICMNNKSNFYSLSATVQMFQSWMSDAYSSLCIQTDCSQCVCPPVAATHDCNLLQNDTISLSMNSWSKSFSIVDKMVFYLSITLASFGMCLWYCFSIVPHTW